MWALPLKRRYIVHRAAGVAGHFRWPAQQAGASEAPVGQQQRTDGDGEQGEVGAPGGAHLRKVVAEKGGDLAML